MMTDLVTAMVRDRLWEAEAARRVRSGDGRRRRVAG
jgi:hypothetical protein